MAGTVLSGVVIYFYFGLTNTNRRSQDIMDVNRATEVALEHLLTDLRATWQITRLKPDSIELRCLKPDVRIDAGFASQKSNFTQISYELVKKEKTVILMRREGVAEFPKEIIEVDLIEPKLFTGYVMQLPKAAADPVPSYKFFDTASQPSEDLPGLVMVGLNLVVKKGQDRMETVTKVHLPMAFSNLIQGDYNLE